MVVAKPAAVTVEENRADWLAAAMVAAKAEVREVTAEATRPPHQYSERHSQ